MVVFTGLVWLGYCLGDLLVRGVGRTLLGECFLVIEDAFEIVCHVEDFV